MITEGSPRENELLNRALSSENPAALTTHRLQIAGKLYRAEALRSFSDEGGPALALETVLAGRLPNMLNMARAPVSVDLLVGGAVRRVFTGELLRPEIDGPTTKLGAASAGYWRGGENGVKLGVKTEYVDAPPSVAAYEWCTRIPYAQIKIPHVDSPRLRRFGPEAFGPLTTVDELLSEVESTAGLRILDDYLNRARGFPAWGSPAFAEPVASFEVGRNAASFRATLKHEGRWGAVRAWYPTPNGDVAWIGDAVPVRERAFSPVPPGVLYPVEFPDGSPTSVAAASQQTFDLARAFSYGEWGAELVTDLIDPRVERGDVLEVMQRDEASEDSAARNTRTWRMRVASHEHDEINVRARYTGEAVIFREERVVAPAALVLSGRASASAVPSLWGLDYAGRPYFDDSLAWVADAGDHVALDAEVALSYGVYVYVAPEDSGVVVVSTDVPPPPPAPLPTGVLASDARTIAEIGHYTIAEVT